MNDDFKFEDNIGGKPTRTRASKKFSLIISILVGLFFGITVFIIVSLLMNKDNKKEVPITTLDIEDKTVQEVYNKYSYEGLGTFDPVFIKNKSVDQESMTNQDKYLLALSQIKETDLIDPNITKDNKKVYYLTPDIIREKMKELFGDEAKYTRDATIENYIFPFTKDNMNTANIKYDTTSARFEVIFNKLTEEVNNIPTNRNYYKELSKAEIKESKLVLTEKIVYVTCEENESLEESDKKTYTCELFKDYDKTISIDTLNNVKEEEIKLDTLKETNTIEYVYTKLNNGNYIFDYSTIEN